jgi:selenocysteine lyase/cysteine desulfurase
MYYPVLGYNTFLNSAQNGLIPTYAAEAMTQYIMHRHVFALDVISMTAMWNDADDLRKKIARMLNCQSSEVLFGVNSSELFNIFSNGIALRPGDNVVTYDCAYFAMTYTWFNKQQDGIETRIAHAMNGAVSAEDLIKLCDEHTRALTVCHVDFGSGYRHDLKKLGHFCRERGIWFGVDATQSCGAMNIDVEEMQIDFLTTSTYKWLQCLLGLGFAYINSRLLPHLKQSMIGWVGTVDKLHNDPMVLELTQDARRFECGGLSFCAMEGLKKTVDAYLRLGKQDVEDYILSLTDYAYQRTAGLNECRVLGDFSPEHRSGIVTIQYPERFGINREFLQSRNINAMPQGTGRCRLSLHYYNNKQDIDVFFDLLDELENKG